MRRLNTLFAVFVALVIAPCVYSQSPSFDTFVNPVIPGDHPDPTLTKIGDDFYTSGSSFNPTPKIYRSTDLVHWEAIAQPVSSEWSTYGDDPGGGIWGGHMVRYNGRYWHFFGRGGGSMYFVTADQPEGPWSSPTRVEVPQGISGLGVDNSIFIDEEYDTWYMLAKHGRENNHIVELDSMGQPTGLVLDLTWLNPDAEDNPYGWAEGPVMWKYNGYYYYSFAQHLAGDQYVMRSDTLTDNPVDWTIKDEPMQYGSRGNFNTPNHIAPAVMLDDGTSWTVGHSYHRNWVTQGRQGLLLEITYDNEGFPEFQYPRDEATDAPDLPSGGIPWMVPKSDMFTGSELDPEWSLLGYTPRNTYSLTERDGWLHLEPYSGENTVIKNDGEHQYTLITRLDFEPASASDEAGLRIINGPEMLRAKVFSSVNDEGEPVFVVSFDETFHTAANTLGSTVWLKLERNGHMISGYYSSDGDRWTLIGSPIDATDLNQEQTDFNDFTGNQQGLYVRGQTPADFDLYIYRDAYSTIAAQYPVNKNGVEREDTYLGGIHDGDWAMYAGVEFGTEVQPEAGFDYQRTPDELKIEASSETSGGVVEVWIDSIDTGRKIAEYAVGTTGNWDTFIEFSTEVDSISGRHDLYLRFAGDTGEELLRLKQLSFTPRRVPTSIADSDKSGIPANYSLMQNYPNPFNPVTNIRFNLPEAIHVNVEVYNTRGQKVRTLVDRSMPAGSHRISFDARNLTSGMYFYRINAGDYADSRKMVLIK